VPISLDSPDKVITTKPKVVIPIDDKEKSPVIPRTYKNWGDDSSSNSSLVEKEKLKPQSTLANLVNAPPPTPSFEEEKVNAARMQAYLDLFRRLNEVFSTLGLASSGVQLPLLLDQLSIHVS